MEELIALDKQLLLLLNGSDSVWLDGVWWMISSTLTWIPMLIVLLYVVCRNSGWRNCLLLFFALGLTILIADQLSSGVIKPWIQRPRPTHDAEIGAMVDIVRGYRGGRYGFVSSHAANTFAIATLLLFVLRERMLSLSLCLWAMLCCYSRMYLGVHYPGDILCGALLGASVGCVVALCFRRHVLLAPYRTRDVLPVVGMLLFTLLCVCVVALF